MRYIIVDLEATCWEGVRSSDMETIEVGAVAMERADGPPANEFSEFVRPMVHPVLSDFCKQLTSIRQEEYLSSSSKGETTEPQSLIPNTRLLVLRTSVWYAQVQ